MSADLTPECEVDQHMPWTLCTGADDCPEQWHEHGCYADHGRCSEPTEHHGWADYAREKARADTLSRQYDELAKMPDPTYKPRPVGFLSDPDEPEIQEPPC